MTPIRATRPALAALAAVVALAAAGPAVAGVGDADSVGVGHPAVRATSTGLSVTVKDTQTQPVHVKLSASEKPGGHGTALRYRAVTATIDPGAKATIALKAPAAVRRQFGPGLQRTGRLVRRPTLTVTNVDTGEKLTLEPRVVLTQH